MIFRFFTKKNWAMAGACGALVVLQVYLELEIPGYMSSITTLLTTGGTTDQVLSEGVKMLSMALGSLLAMIAGAAFASRTAASVSRNMRKQEFDKVESFSQSEIDKFSISSLVTRSTNDITQVQMATAMGMQVMIKAPVMALWAITKIAGKSYDWTMLTALAVVVVLAVIGTVMWFVVPKFKKIQWMTDDLNRVTRENLTGLRVVRAYNAEKYQEDKFDDANKALTDTHLTITRSLAVMGPAIGTVMSFLSLGIYWLGAVLIDTATGYERIILFSDMIVFSSYAVMVIMSFIMLVVIFMIIPRATVARKRVEEVIDTEVSVKDGEFEEGLDGMTGEIEFEGVSFAYPGASGEVLTDVSFKVSKGETVAFIGSTGSGKTTLVNLVPRFYDATSGRITVDGRDVRDYTLEALHRKIGYVPQKAVMLNRTIDENIRYGDLSGERTREDVRFAMTVAQGRDFVEKMESGFDSMVSEGGTNLSGGQKQRVSIARAVCRRPEIYIFDDSFSALDYRTDRELRKALKTETAGTTTLIVAQRIGTIMEADRIVVLDEGRVAGIGRHEELLRDCPVYRDIAASQLSEEELMRCHRWEGDVAEGRCRPRSRRSSRPHGRGSSDT